MEDTARELIRAVRGTRSQRQLARRLGYRSNPVGEWEGGRRWPSAPEFFRVCGVCGIDVPSSLRRFHASSGQALGEGDIAAWLTALRGQRSVSDVARRLHTSRSAVSRWMSGRAHPRLPALLSLVDVCTGRLTDFVAALVPIERVPSLADAHRRSHRARRLLFDHPWAIAVWACLETEPFRGTQVDPEVVGKALGIPSATARACLQALVDAEVLVRRGGTLEPGPRRLVVDTDAVPGGPDARKRHWIEVALQRLERRSPDDQFGYAVFGVSRTDLTRLRDLHRAYYRQVRAIVADSDPTDVVALLSLQLIELGEPPPR